MENTRFVIDRMNHFGKMMRKKRFGPVRNVMKILKRPAQGTSNSRFTTLNFAISRFTALFFAISRFTALFPGIHFHAIYSWFHDSRHFFRDFTIHATFFVNSSSRHFFREFKFTPLFCNYTSRDTFSLNLRSRHFISILQSRLLSRLTRFIG